MKAAIIGAVLTVMVAAAIPVFALLSIGQAAAGSNNDRPMRGAFLGTGLGLDPEQQRNATIILEVADTEQATGLPRLAQMTAALGESNLKVVPNGQGSGYCGVFQAHPSNIPCNATRQQAYRFLRGGKGFQAGGAIALARAQPDLSPGTIATMVEASGQPGSWYDINPNGGSAFAQKLIEAWEHGGDLQNLPGLTTRIPEIRGVLTPKEVIDRVILPIARRNGIPITPAQVEAANAQHSTDTTSGNVSEHKGPPTVAWAADISDAWMSTVGSPRMDHLAMELARLAGIPWTGAGLENGELRLGECLFRLQLIYMTLEGGDHRNHVHAGVHLLSCV